MRAQLAILKMLFLVKIDLSLKRWNVFCGSWFRLNQFISVGKIWGLRTACLPYRTMLNARIKYAAKMRMIDDTYSGFWGLNSIFKYVKRCL